MKSGIKNKKLQRDTAHRKSLIANQIISLIEHRRIRTTLAKAKTLRPFAEKVLTLGKKVILANEGRTDTAKDTPKALHYRRQAIAKLHNNADVARKLITEIAPASLTRVGGYTRITKLGQRRSDSAPMAYIEWVDLPVPVGVVTTAEAGADEAAPAAAPVVEAEEATAEAKPKKTRAKKKAAESEE